MESMYFMFDGINSTDMDLYIMRIKHSGFVDTPFWGDITIHEKTTSKRLTPYFYGVARKPIEFKVQFVLADENLQKKKWTPEERYKIAKWLIHDTYKEFQTSDDLTKKYYAIVSSEVDLNLINEEGYIEVGFKTNSPYAWSLADTKEFDLSDNTTTEIIQLENKSNVVEYYNPIIQIELVGDTTDVQLKNLTNGNKTVKFEGLTRGEIVSIDCQNKIIKSNLFGSNPFEKFNTGIKRYWMDLVQGVNEIEVTGQCKVYVRSQYPIAQ